ncbi:sle1_040 (plasmid) [Streptomyces leeuwenhoekii]|uniref:Sle1_040 protein n=1 Tax=Streptomyces leeuwenhoekii TaxID=1437453 RepID=A0A0F7VPA7_STRLW|nr:sle1_040 [Streptomyces leeuwenhoekii]
MTPAERAETKQLIVHALAHGSQVRQAVAAQGIGYPTFARWRRSDPVFDAQVSEALRNSGRAQHAVRPTSRYLTSPVARAGKARVLEALVWGATMNEAADAADVSESTVRAWRREDPDFDRAVFRLWRAGPEANRPLPLAPDPACAADGCSETDLHARGLCVRHYHQQRRTGRLRPAGWVYGRQDCSVVGCDEPHRAQGFCAAHYETTYRRAT